MNAEKDKTQTIVVATSNPNKAREFAALLPGFRVLPMPEGVELPEEHGSTFEENAREKASFVRDQLLARTDNPMGEFALARAGQGDAMPAPAAGSEELEAGDRVWVMADDSGIEVDALDGAPGIYSARYGGENATDTGNVEKMLNELAGRQDRGARFVCVLVCISATGKEIVSEGIFEGMIAESPRGQSGFGYDPVFIPQGKKLTVSQISAEEKNRISHRARAAHNLLAQLRGG